jgi:hypothetical protein
MRHKWRRDAYAAVFDGIITEEEELSRLYEPLKARLQDESGVLGKLSFSIRRSVDASSSPPGPSRVKISSICARPAPSSFKGRGTLLAAAKVEMLPAWEKGSSEDVTKAMVAFRDTHEADVPGGHAPVRPHEPSSDSRPFFLKKQSLRFRSGQT